MIAIIQCAASKRPGARSLSTADGRPVRFVAAPSAAPADPHVAYAHPDDASHTGPSWRELLREYNTGRDNPLRLLPAWQLYDHPAYGRLVSRCGPENVYILSAGWGLVRADFRIPDYDITLAHVKPEDRFKRREKNDAYADFRMLPTDTREHIAFFGGKAYLPLLAALCGPIQAPKTVFYNSEDAPMMPGYELRRFHTRTRTNWHYECVTAFVDGKISLD